MDDHELMVDPDEDEEFVEEPINVDIDMNNANDHLGFEESPRASEEKKPRISTVETARIDLDTLRNDYEDYALMNRLLFIADVCPPLKFDALKMLIEYVVKNTQNTQMYHTAYQRVEAAKLQGLTYGIEKVPEKDKAWEELTGMRSQNRLEALLAEFKRQKDEAVKESIRRALDEVFHQYVQMGNLQEALKLYGRGMREYCTAPNYVIQMLLNWINVTVYAEQWPKLGILLPQAERAISEVMERESVAASSTSVIQPSFPSSKIPPIKNYKELVQSSKAKIAAVNGLAKLQDKNFKQAAEKFMTVDLDALNYPQLLSGSDVAVYGTLCALATFNRTELKERVLGCTLFRKFLESEPKLVELLQKFCRSQFGVCLDILAELKDQLLLNMFLAPHLLQLYDMIRQSAITQYFDPYLTADINQMAHEFRTTPAEMENELIALIEKGCLRARIDSYNKVLHAKLTDNRTDIYKRVLTLQKELHQRVYSILLRAALQNHRIYDQQK